jgi:hypothetical protein
MHAVDSSTYHLFIAVLINAFTQLPLHTVTVVVGVFLTKGTGIPITTLDTRVLVFLTQAYFLQYASSVMTEFAALVGAVGPRLPRWTQSWN